jgi:AAA domain
MALFQDSSNTQARLKMGIMGFAGDGKTFTATSIAIGLVELMRDRSLPDGDKPVMFIDTETGSDWVKPRFDKANIPLKTAKTRAFSDLLTACKEAQEGGAVLIIDSVTHFWRELTETYAEKRGRRRGLEFQDWAYLKGQWGLFTDAFVNGSFHAILCGRAGYEYDFFVNESGKKELEKTGIKMKAENETGYEPSLLMLMEKHRNMETGETFNNGYILKDRSDRINGKVFKNPTFEDLKPHIEFLNLGGAQFGTDTSRTSADLIGGNDEQKDWRWRAQQKEIATSEIIEVLNKHHGGTTNEAKKTKADLLEKHAGTRSWPRVESFTLEQLTEVRNRIWLELEGSPYNFQPPADTKPSEAAQTAQVAA